MQHESWVSGTSIMPRRNYREIIGNIVGNAETGDSLRHCKWTKSASKTKKPTGKPIGGKSKKNGRNDEI